jgi:hypothetical protein
VRRIAPRASVAFGLVCELRNLDARLEPRLQRRRSGRGPGRFRHIDRARAFTIIHGPTPTAVVLPSAERTNASQRDRGYNREAIISLRRRAAPLLCTRPD